MERDKMSGQTQRAGHLSVRGWILERGVFNSRIQLWCLSFIPLRTRKCFPSGFLSVHFTCTTSHNLGSCTRRYATPAADSLDDRLNWWKSGAPREAYINPSNFLDRCGQETPLADFYPSERSFSRRYCLWQKRSACEVCLLCPLESSKKKNLSYFTTTVFFYMTHWLSYICWSQSWGFFG